MIDRLKRFVVEVITEVAVPAIACFWLAVAIIAIGIVAPVAGLLWVVSKFIGE